MKSCAPHSTVYLIAQLMRLISILRLRWLSFRSMSTPVTALMNLSSNHVAAGVTH